MAGRTSSDMGSGRFPEAGWTWAAYMHNLLVQTNRDGAMAVCNGSWELYISGTRWGSYVYLRGPSAG
ncbi:MAG: neprosin family prolyl endopeptidase [Anaerolineales bacterium]|nr:neprosin family prolyl endopeptidase [Anaerolineales bacterium]